MKGFGHVKHANYGAAMRKCDTLLGMLRDNEDPAALPVLQLLGPDAQRDAVLLSRVAGLGYQEIARQKGISEAAVRGLVARGLARLAGLLGQQPPTGS